ncbi:IS110 family transposase [Paraburkholderia sp. BR10954]|uniref:IS110 family transposase n=1 Tax=Paraburkholderia sp. BR10954 TaxID=3236995 RepID=UPI0034D16C44
MKLAPVGIDIAKSVFQVHYVDEETGEIVNKPIKRAKFLEHFANCTPSLIGIEACGGAHHWARQLTKMGPVVRLMPAEFVKAFNIRNKNDAADARAIWLAVQQPGKPVAVKTEMQQAMLALHRMREQLVKFRAAQINALRGLLAAKLHQLVSVMRAAKQPVTAETVDGLVAAVAGVSNAPDFIEVDDALFAAGLLQVAPLPEMFDKPVSVGQPVNALAARLRDLIADWRREKKLDHADMQRTRGRLSARRHALERSMALLAHGRETFEWPNRVAVALESRDVASLLNILDTPDDHNLSSKQVVLEFHGLKLRGLTAKSRRRAIFELCGLDGTAQAAWEASELSRKQAERKEQDAQRAKEAAQNARCKRGDGVVIDGAQHVEDATASGCQRLAVAGAPCTLRIVLGHPAVHGCLNKASTCTPR